MADATKRMNYFDRQFLRAADFQDEQAYHLDRRRRHNRFLHTPGVADGLHVGGVNGATSVTVSEGTAYDVLGQEIVLPAVQQVDVSKIPGAPATAYLTIAYVDQPTDPSGDPGVTGNSTRTTEIPALAASPTPPVDPNLTLLLAKVTLKNGVVDGLANKNPDNSVRTRAGIVLSDDLIVHSVTLKRDDLPLSSQWPKLTCSGANQATLQASDLIVPDGKLGIGTSNPLVTLHVVGADSTGTGIQTRTSNTSTASNSFAAFSAEANNGAVVTQMVADGLGTGPIRTPGGYYGTYSNHPIGLVTANAERVRITEAGNVGIGTTTAEFMLDIADRIRVRQGPQGPTAGIWLYQTGKDQAFVGMATDTQVGFYGTGAGVGFGLLMDTTNGDITWANNSHLRVDQGGSIELGGDNSTPGTGTPYIDFHFSGKTEDYNARIINDKDGQLTLDAQVVHLTGQIQPPPSDARFKTNITPLTGVLQKVEKITGLSFEWNELYASLGRSTGRREIGLLAQDVEPAFPELVTTWGDEGYKAVDYGRLTAVLVEAVKELKAGMEAMIGRIDALEKTAGEKIKSRQLGNQEARSLGKVNN